MIDNEIKLPPSWELCKLGHIINYGSTSKAEPLEMQPESWLLELEDIEKDTSRLITRSTVSTRKPKSTKNKFKQGQVLYGKLRPYLNKIVIADEDGYCSTEIVPLPQCDQLDERYLFYWLKSPTFLDYTNQVSHGINMPRLGTKAGNEAPFVVAPLAEQRRIADKLDATLAAVEACKEKLQSATETIQRFRQSVLAAAVSGELTREWREKRGIEEEWEFKTAKDVCSKVQSGGTPKEGFTEEGIPFLKVYNIVDQKLSFEYKPQFIDPEIHLTSMKKSRCMPGDVLMNIVGPPLGKVAITPDDHDEWNINQAITLFRPSNEITTEWLYILLCEGKNIREVELSTKGSAGQKNISLTQCREFNFPCPSVEEQQMACELVGSLFEIASTAEERINSAKEHAEKLAPAILAKAFRGELVPQDPNDEPASVLLERIKAQHEAEAAVKKPAKRGRKKKADADQLVIPKSIADNNLAKINPDAIIKVDAKFFFD